MAKKIITINEAQLIDIINESVEKVLTELDWKTYQNAANKDYNHIRGKKFANAAVNKFNDEYGYNDDNGNTISMQNYNKNDNNLRVTSHYTPDSSYDETDFLFSSPSTNDNKSEYYQRYSKNSQTTVPHPYSMDKKHARKIAKAYDDYTNYINNKSSYEKGKGWNKIDNPSDFHKFLKY